MKKKFRFLPHTADIKIEAWGSDLEEAFINAGKAFTDTIVDLSKVGKNIKRRITVEGEDLEELLYNFIEKLILTLDIDNLIFSDYKISIDKKDGFKMDVEAYGDIIDLDKHGFKVYVKAITYHEMEIKKEDNKFIIRYVVDI